MRPVVFVLLAALLFGTTGTAQAFGPDGVDPLSVGAARVLIGGAGLAIVAVILARRANRSPRAPLAAVAPLTSARAGLVVVIGGLGVIAYQPAFFLGTGRNGVAIGTLVALGSAPVLTGALGWLLQRRFPGARWLVATLVATGGVALLAGVGGGSVDSVAGVVDPVGVLASLGAGLSYAVYALASKRLLDAGWSPSKSMGAVFGLSGLFGAVILLFTDNAWLATAPGLAMALWLGLATVTVAYLLFARGLRELSAPTVSTLTLGEPLTASILGILVLGERLSVPSWFGLGLIAIGILILVVAPRRQLGIVEAS
ncbi:DMT family transporter [Amnibacterium flavum]|uniref:EamA family transporter n=1 Tax=Amnibacterium flavum TaxID=2173173 RepID=A0A2V1HSX4_9MICO|nr:EamA family transporter [Amnibacterium flavum]PVZ94060.1 EamA family transporter [Amnibacterium flavum]